ncbi:MAG: NAD-dependent epimerase/dehydratase family protein [Moraxellaceae bacterium]|nr:NAD-dependent epimerase/dehydratase family protein [Pseudobdellovibrionaceae bacterium]
MNTSNLVVCMVGSTGAIGSHVLRFLNEEKKVSQIITLTRKSQDTPLSKERNQVINFDEINRLKENLKADIFICCLGTTIKIAGSKQAFRKVDYNYVVEFGKLAEAVSAQKLLVVSSVGANPKSLGFYSRTKGEMESTVKKLNISSIEIFQPSLLLGERSDFRPAENLAKLIAPLLNPLLTGSMKKYRAVEAQTVAKALSIRSLATDTGFKAFNSDQIENYLRASRI